MAKNKPTWKTLWRANLLIGTRSDHFLFRGPIDFQMASNVASDLLAGSRSAEIVGAVITGIEIKGTLWN